MSKSVSSSSLTELKYVIIFEHGRLGNQLFQYLAARTLAPKAQVICIGLQSLFSSLHPSVCPSVPSKRTRFLRESFARLGRDRSISLGKHKRVWGLITEMSNEKGSSISISKGLFKGLAILDGFFQDKVVFMNVSCEKYPLRSDLLEKARDWIQANVISCGFNPYFLHLRRGDYVRWPSIDHPAVLPFRWYEQQMDEILQSDKRARFIVCTDDHPYVEEHLGSHPMVSIYRGSEIDDFFLMTQCSGGGILSPSTFSWWAAWYGKHFFHGSRYVAPQYWAGWRLREWYPTAIEVPWLDYRAVH